MFLQEIMPAVWMKVAFKNARESMLLEREKSMIPDTMPWVVAESKARGLDLEGATMVATLSELNKRSKELALAISAARVAALRLRGGLDVVVSHHKFIVKCPECPGFLGTDWKCGNCTCRICKYCRDPVGATTRVIPPTPVGEGVGGDEEDEEDEEDVHRCDADTLATARMMKTDTKPCPKCGTPIHKIEGCDQMFDPQCGTAFSWRTGQIATGVIHNPHYFQWMRENGGVQRQPGDVVCGGLPTSGDLLDVLNWVPHSYMFDHMVIAKERCGGYPVGSAEDLACHKMVGDRILLSGAVRISAHIEQVELPRLNTVWDVTTNRPLRVLYVMEEISEGEYTAELYRRERQMEKNREISQVYDTFIQVVGDIMRGLITRLRGITKSETISVAKMLGLPEADGAIRPGVWWDYRGYGRNTRTTSVIKIGGETYQAGRLRIPRNEMLDEAVTEVKAIQQYCNTRFAEIGKSWKLVAPLLDAQADRLSTQKA